MSEDFFAPPPFDPDEALQRAKRELRGLGLVEREGRFDRGAQAIVRIATDAAALKASVVKRPGRSPEWIEKTLRSSADLRDFVADLKKKLASWSDRDE
jgi:hypothetical protein